MFAKTFHFALLILVLVSSMACDRLWDGLNRSSLQADMAALLPESGLNRGGALRECRMIGRSRDGLCRLRISPGELVDLVARLGLTELDRDTPEGRRMVRRLSTVSPSCLATGADSHERHVWTAFGRPAGLRLDNGSAFEYLLLVYVPSEGVACLQVSYAYG